MVAGASRWHWRSNGFRRVWRELMHRRRPRGKHARRDHDRFGRILRQDHLRRPAERALRVQHRHAVVHAPRRSSQEHDCGRFDRYAVPCARCIVACLGLLTLCAVGTTPNAIFVFNIHSQVKNHTISLKEEPISVAISHDASQFAVGLETGWQPLARDVLTAAQARCRCTSTMASGTSGR